MKSLPYYFVQFIGVLQVVQEVQITEENDKGKFIDVINEASDADTKENQNNSYFLVCKNDHDN